MALGIFKKIFGDDSSKWVKEYEVLVPKINALEERFEAFSAEELISLTVTFRDRLGNGEKLDDLLPEVFAAVRESAKRTLRQRHFDVQLIGGMALHNKSIAEMRTGEGKTLVATLPAYLNALSGKGVHVITVNDFLARRDAVWMGQIYAALGMSVGVINHDASYLYDENHKEHDKERDVEGSFRVQYDFLRPVDRKSAYMADITYGTNSEFGFDYLRDNIQYDENRVVQRGHHFAIVDEVDSILIDEARTPLIISAPYGDSENLYATFSRLASSLKPEEHYTVDEKFRAIQLTDAGIEAAEKMLGVDNIYTERGIKYVHHLETAIRAKALFLRERDYVVKDNEVIIVDQSTGRLQPGRRWSEGLHQAIEAKEGVEVQKESRTYASITYQNYFRLYGKLSGMTGTAKTSAEEFEKVYQLEVIEIPTNKPSARKDHNDLILQTEEGKFKAVARKVKELNQKGQPVLLGTVSIEKNELLSAFLTREGVKHEILNAKNHEREALITAQAGKRGAVTLATNLAGRGVDIKLGGEPYSAEAHEEIKALGGLFVLGTERHEARRIDDQLRGRAGRQGDPGETQFYVSLEDSLMKIFGSDKVKSMMGRFGMPEDMPIESGIVSRSIENAQKKVEGFHFDSRKHILEYDDVLNHQRLVIYERRHGVLFRDRDAIDRYLALATEGDDKAHELIAQKKQELGEEKFYEGVRALILQVIDLFWVEHLEQMEYLRGSVRLRAYGQRDPLVEYKREGLQLFKDMEAGIANQVISLLPNLGGLRADTEEKKLQEVYESAKKIVGDSGSHAAGAKAKTGRNDPCPCGSGKKWKACGLINAPEHKS